MSLPANATETAADVASAIVPTLEALPWWHYVAAILVWVLLAAPLIDVVVDETDTKLGGKVWGFVKAIVKGLTRGKKEK